MIVLIPAAIVEVKRWLDQLNDNDDANGLRRIVCPILGFRSSSGSVNDRLFKFVNEPDGNGTNSMDKIFMMSKLEIRYITSSW